MGAPTKPIEVVVANGRTLYVPGTPEEIQDGEKTVYVHQRGRYLGPGSKVMVAPSEVESMRQKGYIVDGDTPVIPTGMGPTFTTESGPSVRALT